MLPPIQNSLYDVIWLNALLDPHILMVGIFFFSLLTVRSIIKRNRAGRDCEPKILPIEQSMSRKFKHISFSNIRETIKNRMKRNEEQKYKN